MRPGVVSIQRVEYTVGISVVLQAYNERRHHAIELRYIQVQAHEEVPRSVGSIT